MIEKNNYLQETELLKNTFSRRRFLILAGAVTTSLFLPIPSDSMEIPPIPEFISPPNQNAVIVPLKQRGTDIPFSISFINESILPYVADFYKKNSYGKMQFSFTTLDWQNVDIPLRNNLENIAGVGDEILNNSGVKDPKKFQTRIYIPSYNLDVVEYAQRRQPETYNRMWINTEFSTTWEHGLGHTLGLSHDDTLITSYADDYSDSVIFRDNENGLSVMGLIGGDLNAPQRIALGWLRRDFVPTVTPATLTNNGEYIITSLDVNTPKGVMALRVPKFDELENRKFYYIQFSKIGSLQFRIWNDQFSSPTEQVFINHGGSQLNAAQQFPQYEVNIGDEFRDRINGIKIKLLNHTDEAALVKVAFG